MKKQPPKRKNVSQKIPNGRTLQTRDEYLESGKGKTNIKPDHPNSKDLYRRVGVIDSNRKDELVIIKLTTHGKHKLDNYLSGKSKYKAFLEIKDNEGNPIKIDGIRFQENKPKRDISPKDVIKIKKDCLTSSKTNKQLRKNNRASIRKVKGRK